MYNVKINYNRDSLYRVLPRTIADDIIRKIDDQVKPQIERRLLENDKAAGKEFFHIVKEQYKRMFRNAVRDFYRSYTPQYYDRKYSLYNILKFDIGEDEEGVFAEYDFLEDLVTQFERGKPDGDETSYQTVFKEGWHGGAKKAVDPKTGIPHPNTGTPYWRTPYRQYSGWCISPAARSKSPYDGFMERKSKYENTPYYDKLQIDILNKHRKLLEINFNL